MYINDEVVNGDKHSTLMDTPSGLLVAQSVLYNSSAYVGMKKNELTKQEEKTAIGNVTECGLINYLTNSGVDTEDMIAHRKGEGFKKFDIPFSSSRKRATCVVALPDGGIRVFVKGAPEIVIE